MIIIITGIIKQIYKFFLLIIYPELLSRDTVYYRITLVYMFILMLLNTPLIYCLIYPTDFIDNGLYIKILLICITNYLFSILLSFFKPYNEDELIKLILNNDERIRKENLRLVKEDVNKYMINDLTNIVIEYYNTYIIDESYENIV
jgi:hypothetical protein